MNKLFFSLTLLLIALGCEKKAVPQPQAPRQVTATQPTLCDVPLYREYVGHVVAKTNIKVMAQASGIITQQAFVEGQEVKQGDLLLVIDPRPYEAALTKAEGQLEETFASLRFNREKTTRYASLVQQDFVSQLDYDQYVTNVMTDEALIKQNQAELEQAKINLGYCYIIAPMDCVTGKLQVKAGNYVDDNANTTLTTLTQIQPILVDFFVPETDLLLIQQQQVKKGNLTLLAYPNADHKVAFQGALTLIDNQVNTGTGSILLEGTFANEDKILWPGHFVDVRLILGEQKDALLVPTEALLVGQAGYYVYVVKGDFTVQMRPVTIGQRYDEMTCIVSGISAKDKVIVKGQLNLYPGLKVEVKQEDEP